MNEAIIRNPLKVPSQILMLIGGYFIKTKKEWNLIDQQWMLKCLSEWYGTTIARSVLCYHLKQLVADGYLNRVTRHRRNPETGAFEPRVTLYKMTFKLKAFILRMAAYMRGIGWKNQITAAVKRTHQAARQAAERAAEAARQVHSPPLSYEAFKISWRKALGVT